VNWEEFTQIDRRRYGRLNITPQNLTTDECRQALHMIEFIPLQVNHDVEQGHIELIGCSPKFREIDQAEAAPQYELIVRIDDMGMGEVREARVFER
jgi:hypothetical protein